MATGSSATQSVSVTNTGTATVNISQVTISGAGFTVVGANASTSVPVGQSATVQVQFAPTSLGAVTGSLTVISDASNSPLAITLTGTGMQPTLTISPSSLNFSNVVVGQTSTQTVALTNSGNANLVLNLATISGPGFGMSSLGLPKTIAAGQSLSVSVQFTPTSTTGASGSIVFTDNTPTSPQTLTMTGSALVAGSTLTPNPGSFNFGNVVVASTSTQPITLTNSGTATITINTVGASGPGFNVSGISAGQTIAAGGTASLTAKFAPTAAGTVSGNITITTNATNPTMSIPLSGTGTQGTLVANPASIAFGNRLVGSSGTVPVTLTNSGTAPISITATSITGTSFTMAGLAPQTINPGLTSTFTVKFAPTSTAGVSGSVSITSNAPGSPLTINLTGSGTATQAQMTISPSLLAFNNVNAGSSTTQNVTLTNGGNATLNITAVGIAGPGYIMNLTAPTTINAGTSKIFTVTFAPTAASSAPGTISITSNAPTSPATLSLSAAGIQAQASANPTSASFGTVTIGNSNSQPITLTNSGNTTLTFSQVTPVGTGFSVTGLSTATTIAAGASVTFNVVFTPSSTATVNGSLTLVTNGKPSPLVINLSGTGLTAARSVGASPASLNFNTVSVGNSSSLTTTLTNSGNSSVNVSAVTVTGAGFTASGVSNGTILTAGQSVTLTITFDPTSAGAVTGASVQIASNATNSPATIALSGTGQTTSSHSVTLSWTASTTGTVSGYNIFRATTSGGYGTTPLNSSPVPGTTYTDTTVAAGQTYFYVATAVGSGVSSIDSNEVPATIP